jgi:hypothetical protein
MYHACYRRCLRARASASRKVSHAFPCASKSRSTVDANLCSQPANLSLIRQIS